MLSEYWLTSDLRVVDSPADRGVGKNEKPLEQTTVETLIAELRARGIRVAERSYGEPETGATVEVIRMFGL